jgi:hypothetical protein
VAPAFPLGILFAAYGFEDEVPGDGQPVHVQPVAVIDVLQVAPRLPVLATAADAEVRLGRGVRVVGGCNDETAAGSTSTAISMTPRPVRRAA